MTAPAGSPLVSVIIPAFNAERYLRETLDAVLAQTYRHLEVIVVDDCSTDGTRDCIAASGGRVRGLHLATNSGGCSRPRNEGIRIATGELLVFIDADDVMAPDRIETQVRFFQAHPDVGLVFSNYLDFDERGRGTQDHFSECPILHGLLQALPADAPGLVLDPAQSTEMLLTENFGSSSPMVRREVVDAVGVFDESLRPSEDFDFQYRVSSRYRIGLVPRVGWYKRLHQSSMSSNLPNIMFYKILTRRRLLDRETMPGRRRKLKRMLASYYVALAFHHTGRDNALAFRNAIILLRFRARAVPRLLARIALDLLGRDTTGARRAAAAREARPA